MSMLHEAVATIPSTIKIGGWVPAFAGTTMTSCVPERSLRERLLPARGLAHCRPLAWVSLAGRGRLLCGARSRRGRPPCRCLAAARPADPAAAPRGHVGVGHAAAQAAPVPAAALLVDGCPCAPLGFLLSDAAMLLSFLAVLCFAVLA